MGNTPSADLIATVQAAYDSDRYLDAYRAIEDGPAPETWTDTEARILAGRVFMNVGGRRRANNLHGETWKSDRQNLRSFYYYALGYVDRHGSFEALDLIEKIGADVHGGPEPENSRALLWLLQSRLLTSFRDFRAAEEYFERAQKILPNDPWTYVQLAGLREAEDRYEEALAAAERARAVSLNYRPAIEVLTHLLAIVERDDEAVSILETASANTQCGTYWYYLAEHFLKRDRFEAAEKAYARAEELWPLRERALASYIAQRRVLALYSLGEYKAAAKLARESNDPAAERIEKILEGAPPRRAQLPVRFVRQHHMTCAPATISAISSFWGRPIDHLSLAEVITYDGTPDHVERHWLQENGWLVREFRVTWEVAIALIDRGIPFSMVTTWVSAAHLQAVVGYDSGLRQFVIRDPYHHELQRRDADQLLSQQIPFGPRGMIFLPPDQVSRCEGVDFPEADLYDTYFTVRRALHRFDRAAATAAAEDIAARAPGSRLDLWAKRDVAYFDQNPLRIHEIIRTLRSRFPEEGNLRIEELASLQRLGRLNDRATLVAEFATNRSSHPIFWREFVKASRADARERARTKRYARRLVRIHGLDCENLHAYADVLGDEGDFAGATRVL